MRFNFDFTGIQLEFIAIHSQSKCDHTATWNLGNSSVRMTMCVTVTMTLTVAMSLAVTM